MNFLSDAQWHCINDTILAINSVSGDPEFRTTILERLRLLVPYESAAFFLTDLSRDLAISSEDWHRTPRFLPPVAIDVPKSVLDSYLSTYWHQDYVSHQDITKLPKVFREESIAQDDEYTRSAYYNDYLHGRHVVNCTFANEKGFFGWFNLNRRRIDGDFTDKELHILQIIEPHIMNRLSRWHVRAEETSTDQDLVDAFHLSRREMDIVHCVTEGLSNNDIAAKLAISTGTVKKHLENVFRKTGVSSRTELAMLTRDTPGKPYASRMP